MNMRSRYILVLNAFYPILNKKRNYPQRNALYIIFVWFIYFNLLNKS